MCEKTIISNNKRTEIAGNKSPGHIKKGDLSLHNISPVDHIIFLQGTIGNQAVGRLIKSAAYRKKEEGDELAHVIQRQVRNDHLQRLTDPVNLNPVRNNAQACLLHLHGNETNALSVAQELYNTRCVNLAYIDHPGSRLINVDNFYLVTDPADFLTLRSNRNVVLQSMNAPNDGSLSVVLRSGRYINIEAQNASRNLNENRALGTEALDALGISQLPCPVIQRTPDVRIQRDITSADLPRQRTSDPDRFMRRVYDLQVMLRTSQGAAYVAGVPNADLVAVASGDALPGRHIQLHRDIASRVQSLLTHARQDLASARAAHEPGVTNVTDIRLRSGYRSAHDQLTVWERNYPQYYRDTRAHRRTLSGGEHGEDAARYLASHINQLVFSPGYSPHQQGQTVDFTYNQNNNWAEADSSASGIRMWQNSWLFRWLMSHAAQYGFAQNPNINEPWHWEFRPTMALIISFFQWLRELVLRILQSLRSLFMLEEAEEIPSDERRR